MLCLVSARTCNTHENNVIPSGLFKYKRTAATHIFVVMISTQSRSRKPYALPVECIPYVSMTHEHVRKILNNLISLMVERKMKISGNWIVIYVCVIMYDTQFTHLHVYTVGFVSNGEYNSMRVKGYTRPLSVLQIRSEARGKYSSMGAKSMLEMLTPTSEYQRSCNVYNNNYGFIDKCRPFS